MKDFVGRGLLNWFIRRHQGLRVSVRRVGVAGRERERLKERERRVMIVMVDHFCVW